jgi:tetratricopeptide (TPR) repeat protein
MRTNRVVAIIFFVILVASGCRKRVPITALPPAAPAPAAPAPVAPPPDPAAAALDDANRIFSAASYDEAARAYENYLKLDSGGPRRDEALFRLGIAYALRTSADWQRASTAFRQIMEVFPNSPFRGPASLILSLHSELDQANTNAQQRDLRIRQLTTELDRLKRIDADRRKRP